MRWVERLRASRWAFVGGVVLPVVLLAGALVWLVTRPATSPSPKTPAKSLPAPRSRSRRTRSKALARPRRKPRTFISFAVEDDWARTLLVGQSKHEDTPFDLADFSLHKPFDNAWKTQTRPRIKGCDVVIVLIGKGTHAAEGVLWEIKAAKEEGVPIFGVHIDKDDKGRKPGSLSFGIPVINWSWDGIARQMKKAVRLSQRA